MKSRKTAGRERGATLIVALVMLVALALLGIGALNSSTTNVRIAGNAQVRQESLAAVQAAIEKTISSTAFARSPDTVAQTPIEVDVDGDGRTDYVARLSPAPVCYRHKALLNSQLDLAAPAVKDRDCVGGSSEPGGIDDDTALAPSGESLCANSDWNIRAVVTDANTRATTAIHQGIRLHVLKTDAATNCP